MLKYSKQVTTAERKGKSYSVRGRWREREDGVSKKKSQRKIKSVLS